MAAPYSLFEGDGVETTFVYGFEVFSNASTIRVFVREANEAALVQQVAGTHYIHIPSDSAIEFQSGYIPGDGAIIRVERYTLRDRQIDWQPGSTLSDSDLDEDANRLTSVDQEIEAGLLDALRRNDAGTHWNGEGIASENCAPADSPEGWVTLAQMQAALNDVTVAELNEPKVYTFEGDGITAIFELTNTAGLLRAQADVYIEGVYQSSRANDPVYSISGEADSTYPTQGTGNDFIEFAVAPPDNAIIEVKVFTGTVLGVLPDEFVNDPDQIADDLIGEQHLKVSAGDAGRILTFDADGQPTLVVPGLQHLIASSQTLQAAQLNAMTHATTGIALDQFARAMSGNLDIHNKKLLRVGSPTGSTDGVNKSYVDGKVFGWAEGLIDGADMPTVAGNHLDVSLNIGQRLLVLQARFRGAASFTGSTYVRLWPSGIGTGRIHGGGSPVGGLVPPDLRIQKQSGNVIRITLVAVNHLLIPGGWSHVGWLALKFPTA